ncbi:LysR family transcriptional regulator [Breoghania sp. L-A4]|uniref:LysR family transcriptional regulator n=1 Tax=Breoghania sp. L-A4 TaxID=2304600 RepID=UPI0013C2DEBB|nr:LysR family transcriptional regulator [Breoghania sp. L-A4]
MLSWDDHHLVLLLAQRGTLAAAARHLGVNETTIARRLAALEASVGATLFRRADRKLVPNASGRAIVAAAEAMERALEAVSGSGEASGATVRVSAVLAVIERLIAPALPDFAARHPGIVLELVGSNDVASLARREADISIRLARPERGKLVARRIGMIQFRLAGRLDGGAPGYLAYDRDLDGLPEIRALAGRFDGPPLARIGTLTGLRAAVEAGLGAAMLPDWMIRAAPLLHVIDETVRAERPVWLVVHEDLKDRPSVRAAFDWLGETVANACGQAA